MSERRENVGDPVVKSLNGIRERWLLVLGEHRSSWQNPHELRMSALVIERFFVISGKIGYSTRHLAPGLDLVVGTLENAKPVDDVDDMESIKSFWEEQRQLGDEVFLRADANAHEEMSWRILKAVTDRMVQDFITCPGTPSPAFRGMVQRMTQTAECYQRRFSDAAAAARVERETQEIMKSSTLNKSGRSRAEDTAVRFARELRGR